MSKVAIVGVEGSGKTVLMAALAETYGQATHDGVYLMPENQAAFSFMTMIPHKMRVERQWPAATAIQGMKYLKWTVRVGPEVLAELEMLDYPGELYRLAFGERKEEEIEGSRTQVHEFLEHLVTADDLIVLFNLKDAMDIGANARNNETVWLTRGIFDYAKKLPNIKRRLLLFTQADRYRAALENVGGAKALQNKYLPMLGILHPDLECGAVSAVEAAETDQPAPAAEAGDGLRELMKRMVLTSKPGQRAMHLLAKCRDAAKQAMQVHENWAELENAVGAFNHALKEIGALEAKIIEFLCPGELADLKTKHKKADGLWCDIPAIAQGRNAAARADESMWKDVLEKYRGEAAFVATIRNLIEEAERNRMDSLYVARIRKLTIIVLVAVVGSIIGFRAWAGRRDHVISQLDEQTRLSSSICEMAFDGDPDAQYLAGLAYLVKGNTDDNYTKALKWLMKSAKRKHAYAQFKLGTIYEQGLGTPKDFTKASQWYWKAAEQGHAGAQYRVGNMYRDGLGVAKDETEAITWFRAAAKRGDTNAQAFLGKWYRDAAEQGDAEAQFFVGRIFSKGLGVETNEAEAVKWYRLAADQGNALAQCNLGWMYDEGRGVAKDEAEAVKWYRLAADQGNASAQLNLGVMYEEGRGVAQDYAEAVKWYRLAADQGNASAQRNLGVMYAQGRGVAKGYAEAVMWLQKAANQGNTDAQRILGWMK